MLDIVEVKHKGGQVRIGDGAEVAQQRGFVSTIKCGTDGIDIGIASVCTVVFMGCTMIVVRGTSRIRARFHFETNESADNSQIPAMEFLKSQTAATMLTAPTSSVSSSKASK